MTLGRHVCVGVSKTRRQPDPSADRAGDCDAHHEQPCARGDTEYERHLGILDGFATDQNRREAIGEVQQIFAEIDHAQHDEQAEQQRVGAARTWLRFTVVDDVTRRREIIEPYAERDGHRRKASVDREADLALERDGGEPRQPGPQQRQATDVAALVVAVEQQHADRDGRCDAPREGAKADLFEAAVEGAAQIIVVAPQAAERRRPTIARRQGAAEQ